MKKTVSDIALVPLLGHGPQESLTSAIDRRSDYYRQVVREKQHQAPKSLLNLPNVLTIMRIGFTPVLIALWFAHWRYAPICCAALFILQSITDWLDGYLARRLKLTSAFGAFLDPVADKLMVCATLTLLACSPPPPIPPALMSVIVIAIIGREITMSALREWAALSSSGAHKAVKVNSLGKWKTAVQMVAMSVLLVCREGAVLVGVRWQPQLQVAVAVWAGGLGLGALLGLWSLALYFSNVWSHFYEGQHHAVKKTR